MSNSASHLFTEALRRFDAENTQDPNIEMVAGQSWPRELIHAHWLSAWVLKLSPHASETLQLAARCQHLCRWKIPRADYEMTKSGYLRWRTNLKEFHAQMAGEILLDVGYAIDLVQKVQALNLKRNFPTDPESRVLEDALCLVFLEHQLAELAARTDDAKIINALRKSWQKMTPAAHEHALHLPFPPRARQLLTEALA